MAAALPHSQLEVPPADDPRVRPFFDILSRVPPEQVEAALVRCGMSALPSTVESVLRLSYGHPAAAVKFFRWAGQSLKHTPYAWNLMVDILGKNGLFEGMWDAIRSMKGESALTTATFASAFGSYSAAGRIKEALMTFDVMQKYGVQQDVVSLNALLSAICRRDGNTSAAAEFFELTKSRIPPDADTFAILLEGWEKEGNVPRAKVTFGEMVIRVGWRPDNMSAHDAFLTTLIRAGGAHLDEAFNFLRVMKSKGCVPGIKFFGRALDALIKRQDLPHAVALWDLMVGESGLIPNLIMYNAVIALLCNANQLDSAYRLLDTMSFNGAFPDSLTYNTVFECLVRSRRTHEAERFLAEMRRNEQTPSPANCAAAIKMFFEHFDSSAAFEVWDCVLEERVSPAGECAEELLLGLMNLGRLSDLRRYADNMIDRGIEIRLSTMEKLKPMFQKVRKMDMYDQILEGLKRI